MYVYNEDCVCTYSILLYSSMPILLYCMCVRAYVYIGSFVHGKDGLGFMREVGKRIEVADGQEADRGAGTGVGRGGEERSRVVGRRSREDNTGRHFGSRCLNFS